MSYQDHTLCHTIPPCLFYLPGPPCIHYTPNAPCLYYAEKIMGRLTFISDTAQGAMLKMSNSFGRPRYDLLNFLASLREIRDHGTLVDHAKALWALFPAAAELRSVLKSLLRELEEISAEHLALRLAYLGCMHKRHFVVGMDRSCGDVFEWICAVVGDMKEWLESYFCLTEGPDEAGQGLERLLRN